MRKLLSRAFHFLGWLLEGLIVGSDAPPPKPPPRKPCRHDYPCNCKVKFLGASITERESRMVDDMIIYHSGYAQGMRQNCFATRDPERDAWALKRAEIHEEWVTLLNRIRDASLLK